MVRRPKLLALPLDQADRRIVGIGLVLVLAFLVVCVTVAAGLGLGVRVFFVLSGVGG